MAALNFPNSPSIGQTHTENAKTWVWDGTSWNGVNAGQQGYTGSAGGTLGESTYTTTASITPNMATTGIITITAQAEALAINNPTGSPVQGQKLVIRIKDDGTARTLTFDTQYRSSSDLALPTTTTSGKTLYMGFFWNNTDTKLDLVAMLNNF